MLSPRPLQVELGLLGFIQVHKLPFAHVLDMPKADQLLVQHILNSRQTHETNLEPYPWTALFGLPLTKNLPSTAQRLLLSCLPGILFLNRKCFSLNPQQLVTLNFYNQCIYMNSLIKLCSKIIFGILSEYDSCPSVHARENRITDLFSGLIGPPFPVDPLHHIINKWWQAADQHFNRKMDYCTAFFHLICNVCITYCADKMHATLCSQGDFEKCFCSGSSSAWGLWSIDSCIF